MAEEDAAGEIEGATMLFEAV